MDKKINALFQITFLLLLVHWTVPVKSDRYEPNWDSLDKRPLPRWYDDAKVGIFIHWGVFSVPAMGEWFWWNWKGKKVPEYQKFMNDNFKPNFSYAEFAPLFTAENFRPNKWAQLFRDSGAKYVVLTSKHHEGYTLWPSNTSWNWNSVDVGPKRDIVGELADAVRGNGLTFGLYHSLFEWFNPLYNMDLQANFTTRLFPHAKTIPELTDIVLKYKPEVIWSDGEWDGPDSYWGSTKWLAWLYNDSPVRNSVVTNDRWAYGTLCNHGGFLTCADRYLPEKLVSKKWENAMTLDRNAWGYVRRSTLSSYLSFQELMDSLVKTVSLGGNLLINIGPKPDGTIPVVMEERLRQLGAWLKVNGEAIYKTKPWIHQNDSLTENVYYTQSKESDHVVYAIFLRWPKDNVLKLGSLSNNSTSQIMQIDPSGGYIQVKKESNPESSGLLIYPRLFPEICCAWVLKFNNSEAF